MPISTWLHQGFSFPFTRRLNSWVGQQLSGVLEVLGQTVANTSLVFGFVFKGQASLTLFLEQAARFGWGVLPMALLLSTFTGMVIALQVATEMVKQGGSSFVGALVALAMVRELAPMMTGFSALALSGSAYAAEIASMQGNNQLDALRVLHVNPVRYLMVSRVLAATLMLPLLTCITTTAGVLGGGWVSHLVADVPPSLYQESVLGQLKWLDVFGALLKAAVFGFSLSVLSCSIGLAPQVQAKGTQAVGQATTRAVVWSFVTMAALDYLLSLVLFGSR